MNDLTLMLPKLAELCGIKIYQEMDQSEPRISGSGNVIWRPDEDVEQAVRCLEAAQAHGYGYCIERAPSADRVTVHVIPPQPRQVSAIHFIEDMERISMMSSSLPANICLALAAALGWDAP